MAYSSDDIIVLSISAAVIIAISVLLGFTLRNKSQKIKQIPLIIIAILLLGLELTKQLLEIIKGYNFWALPIHFCSTYFIWFSIAHFTKGKFSEGMKTVAFVSSFYLVALFYFNPQSIIGPATSDIFGNFSNFHTFTFHHLVILYFCLNVTLLSFHFKMKHLIYWFVSMSSYYAITVLSAHLLQVNYMSILTSSISFMENLRLSIGQVGYTIILGLLTIGVGALIILIASLITSKIKQKQKET